MPDTGDAKPIAEGKGGEAEGEEKRIYERKDDAYFGYYAMLSHQAQMLQDGVRTTAYQRAILGNAAKHFRDKLVIDVGAGNGILSLFACQAGAKKVFAVEASNMIDYLKKLVAAAHGPSTGDDPSKDDIGEDEAWYLEGQGYSQKDRPAANAWLADRLAPVHSKMEDVSPKLLDGEAQVDTIVSECLGVLLVHERMCESFIDARDRFLKPGGALFPSAGTICFAPIEDKVIWDETANKARFWQSTAFYNVDLNPFFPSAWREAFSSPVVGCFNPQTLISSSIEHLVDFYKVSMEELRTFEIPLEWTIRSTGLMHGIGGWFDLDFQPPAPSEAASPSGDTTDDDDIMTDSAALTEKKTQDHEVAYSGLSVTAPPFEPATTALPSGDATIDFGTDGLASNAANDTAAALLAAAMAANTGSTMPNTGTGLPSSSSLPLTMPAAVSGDPSESTNSNTSFMSTSPFCTPTHWQQARLLLPEPLAVNRGQKVKGWMKFRVNENRSYDIDAEIWLVDARRGGSASQDGQDQNDEAAAPGAGTSNGASETGTSAGNDKSTRRRWKWKLDRQSYSWTTAS